MRPSPPLAGALLLAALSAPGLRAEPAAPAPGCTAQRVDLPGCRVVSYYGNPLSKRMGILGEIPVDEMLERLEAQA